MKKFKYSLAILLAVFLFASCEKETEGISRVTYYCELDLKGDAVVFVVRGNTFTDPGWVASENDVDVSANVKVAGTVNTQTTGIYRLVYSIDNVDGFPKTTTRQVVVYDATPSVMPSGFYTVDKSSNRNNVAYGRDFTIMVYQVEPGIFYVADLLGGWYEQRAGYGSRYAMEGIIELDGANDITLLDSFIAGWGDGLDDLTNGSYDPVTNTLSYTAQYAGTLFFNVIATPQ